MSFSADNKKSIKLVKIPLPNNAVFSFTECCQHAPNRMQIFKKISGDQTPGPQAAGTEPPDPQEGKGKGGKTRGGKEREGKASYGTGRGGEGAGYRRGMGKGRGVI
jgi:hypothetical protein